MFFAPEIRTARFVPRAPDRSFERFVNGALMANPTTAATVEQDDTSWTVSLDVPGVTRDDLSIGIEGAIVRIESRAEAKRRVKAAFELPLEIDTASSQASLDNGVLTLKLGKLLPKNKVHQLAIS
jgi:HSP20 family molecular chaperone IbpA